MSTSTGTNPAAHFIAIDLGAASGRVMLGRCEGSSAEHRIHLHELHRFPNGPVEVLGHIHWDVLRLWEEILRGLRSYAAAHQGPLAGIGIDTWAVDFGLLDSEGHLVGNPYHYRDCRTDGVADEVDSLIPPQQVYERTGIQRLPFNTLYQLASMKRDGRSQLNQARSLLLMPDLFHYWLTGRIASEYTNATTTQFFDPRTRRWAVELLNDLGLPAEILPPVVQPGTVLGNLLPEVCAAVGLASRRAVPIVAVASHDTASAVAAIPGLDEQSAYISSGTWSLVGIEIREPILTERAMSLNFTNEGGVGGTIRFLKNVAGLWLLQECRREWAQEGRSYTWLDLEGMAAETPPMRSVIDPDAPDFLHPSDMRAAIKDYCRRTGQPEPTTVGEFARCCLDSLALRYRWVLEALEQVAEHRLETVRIVGGGSQNRLLCQLTADVSGRQVVAGPVEATALGNIMVQAVASGLLPDIQAGRRAVGSSVELVAFVPAPTPVYDEAFDRFVQLVGPPW
ncbi:MAG TPA: rhamnulokinase family protein [Chloroflexota bacterium]|nr:rhamnulokinase family protein [Chloroflexota bacterium]